MTFVRAATSEATSFTITVDVLLPKDHLVINLELEYEEAMIVPGQTGAFQHHGSGAHWTAQFELGKLVFFCINHR